MPFLHFLKCCIIPSECIWISQLPKYCCDKCSVSMSGTIHCSALYKPKNEQAWSPLLQTSLPYRLCIVTQLFIAIGKLEGKCEFVFSFSGAHRMEQNIMTVVRMLWWTKTYLAWHQVSFTHKPGLDCLTLPYSVKM